MGQDRRNAWFRVVHRSRTIAADNFRRTRPVAADNSICACDRAGDGAR